MKRLNVKLLVILLAGVVVLSGAAFGLRMMNLSRTLEAVKQEAQLAEEEDRAKDAMRSYQQYLAQRPTDAEAYGSYALLLADYAQDPTAPRGIHAQAFDALETALRLDRERDDVRERLIEYTMLLGRIPDAIEHITVLLDKTPDDGELLARLGQCYIRQNKLDEARDALDRSLEAAPERVETYGTYAQLARNRLDDPELADELLNRMIEQNPGSERAYLIRAQYRNAFGLLEEARQDLAEALTLAPDDVDVLLTAANLDRRTERFDEARGHLNKALEIAPANAMVYRMLAALAAERGDNEEAFKHVLAGLEQVENDPGLLEMATRHYIREGELDKARAELKKLEDVNFRPEFIDVLQAQIQISERRWVQAAQILESARPLLARNRDMRVQVNLLLGTCYQNLGQTDLEIEVYRRVLDDAPDNEIAKARMIAAQLRSGQLDEARNFADEEGRTSQYLSVNFQLEINSQLNLPKEERDWSKAEQLLARLKAVTEATEDEELRQLREINGLLFEAELRFHTGDQEETERLVKKARDERSDDVAMWVAVANFESRVHGPDAMLAVINEADAKLGPSLLLEQKRLEALRAIGGDELVAKLKELETTWPKKFEGHEDERGIVAALLGNLGETYFSLANFDEAQRLLKYVEDEYAPAADLRLRMRRFEMALALGNDEGMQEAIDAIADVIGQNSAEWNYAQAARRVALVARQAPNMGPDELDNAREYLERAEEIRPRWHFIFRVRAQIEKQQGNYQEAIDNYELAIEYGEQQRGHYMDLIRLYSITNQGQEALALLERVKRFAPDSSILDRGEMFIRMQTKDYNGALEAARRVMQTSEEARDWVEYAKILAYFERTDPEFENDVTAEEAFQKAIEFDPTDGTIWVSLVQHLVESDQKEEAQAAIDQMAGNLPDEQEPVVMALCLELMGDVDAAEQAHLRSLQGKPNDLNALRRLVTFYMRIGRVEPASEYLDKLLTAAEKAVEQGGASGQQSLVWARRQKAQMLAASGNYRKLQEALTMLELNEVNGEARAEDLLLRASMLAARSDRDSRLEAIQLLITLKERYGSESPATLFILAQLYDREGDPESWIKCREAMLNLLALAPNNPSYTYQYIRMLLRHADGPGDLIDVEQYVSSLERMGNENLILDAKARYLVAAGRTDEAAELLSTAVPPIAEQLPEEVPRLIGLSLLAEELELYEAAEDLLQRYLRRRTDETLRLAAFYGRRHRLEDALFVCQQAIDEGRSHTEVCGVGAAVLRACLTDPEVEVTDDHFSKVEGWIDKALAEETNTVAVKLTLADLRDAQGRYDQAVRLYEEILAESAISDQARVTALNNLAFIYAVRDGNGRKAQPLIDEAINIIGPISEVLDTRAMVLLAMGDNGQAISLLESAVAANPEESLPLFHLAKARKAAGDMEGFSEAMREAQDNGLQLSELPALEHESYRELMEAFELIETR